MIIMRCDRGVYPMGAIPVQCINAANQHPDQLKLTQCYMSVTLKNRVEKQLIKEEKSQASSKLHLS